MCQIAQTLCLCSGARFETIFHNFWEYARIAQTLCLCSGARQDGLLGAFSRHCFGTLSGTKALVPEILLGMIRIPFFMIFGNVPDRSNVMPVQWGAFRNNFSQFLGICQNRSNVMPVQWGASRWAARRIFQTLFRDTFGY